MVALDTNLFIYALEGNPKFGKTAARILRQAQDNGSASEFVYLELLSKRSFLNSYERNVALDFLDSQRLQFVPMSKEILLKAAYLRAEMTPKIGVGDALHLASAIYTGADTFITNDQRLVKLMLSDLKIAPLA